MTHLPITGMLLGICVVHCSTIGSVSEEAKILLGPIIAQFFALGAMDTGMTSIDEIIRDHGSAPPAKVRAVEQGEKTDKGKETDIQELRRVMLTVSKLCLSSALQARVVRAILIEATRVPGDNPYLVQMNEATKTHHEAAEKMRAAGIHADIIREKLGGAHLQAFNACVALCLKQLKEPPQSTANQEASKYIEGFIQEWQPRGIASLGYYVRHWCRTKMFDKSVFRLEFNVQDHNVHMVDAVQHNPYIVYMHILRRVRASPKAVALQGLAPKGGLEQQIQRFIDSHSGGAISSTRTKELMMRPCTESPGCATSLCTITLGTNSLR